MAGKQGATPTAAEMAPTPELLIASVLHLMSHYLAAMDNAATRASLSLAIERHFHALSKLQDLAPILRGTCSQLSQQWGPLAASNAARTEKRPGPPSLLARLRRRAA